MNPRTLWDERMGMLMACGSPGSALAYHLGQTTFEPMMVQRGKPPESNGAEDRRVACFRRDRQPRIGGRMRRAGLRGKAGSVALGIAWRRGRGSGRCASAKLTWRSRRISSTSRRACAISTVMLFFPARGHFTEEICDEEIVEHGPQLAFELARAGRASRSCGDVAGAGARAPSARVAKKRTHAISALRQVQARAEELERALAPEPTNLSRNWRTIYVEPPPRIRRFLGVRAR